MGKRKIIILMTVILLILISSSYTVFAESSTEPNLEDITGIRFEPASSVMLKELLDGTLDVDDVDYYFAYNYGKIFQNGSALILINKNGMESRFVLDMKRDAFICEDGHAIDRDVVSCYSSDNKYEDVWEIGNHTVEAWGQGEHPVTVEYRGFTCETSVSVVDNNITAIEYIQYAPLIENRSGQWWTDSEGEKFFYYDYSYGNKDMVKLTLRDGTVKKYTYTQGDEYEDDDILTSYYFRCNDGSFLTLYDLYRTDDQMNNHWTRGGENYTKFTFAGKECQSRVLIKLQNTMKAKGKTIKVRYAKLRRKTQKIAKYKVFTISKEKGPLTFTKVKSDKKAKNKITISKKGIVSVKKGLKKGKYTIKVKVTAAGNKTYTPISKTVAIRIIVK